MTIFFSIVRSMKNIENFNYTRIYTFIRAFLDPNPFDNQKNLRPISQATINTDAEFHKSWGWHNNGCMGFLLAVENVTNRLFVHLCKTKETHHWEEAIEKLIELTRNVSTIYSDCDTVVTSRNFAHIYCSLLLSQCFVAEF